MDRNEQGTRKGKLMYTKFGFWLLFLTMGLFTNSVEAKPISTLSTPVQWAWVITDANSVLDQEFLVTQEAEYSLFLGFDVNPQTEEEMAQTFEFIGSDGRHMPNVSGTMIPLHIKITALDNLSKTQPIMDQTFKTVGMSQSLLDFSTASRDIGVIDLKPGKYQITATTLQDTKVPSIVKMTFLEMVGPNDIHAPSSSFLHPNF